MLSSATKRVRSTPFLLEPMTSTGTGLSATVRSVRRVPVMTIVSSLPAGGVFRGGLVGRGRVLGESRAGGESERGKGRQQSDARHANHLKTPN